MEQLQDKVAVITGGASGIGLATAKRLAREGMRIALADLNPGSLEAARREVAELGGDVAGIPTDVSVLRDVQVLADRVFDRFGAAHVVFNNAGVALSGPMHKHTHAEWEWVMGVNLWGPIHGVEVFVPRLVAQAEGGHVINTASFAGLVPNVGLGAYCVTKYGVVALSECLARDLRGTGIGVSVLCPMMVATGIGENSERDHPSHRSREARQPPGTGQGLGRTLEAGEVADRVHDAIRSGDLYIVTHEESREFVRRRFERIDAAFDAK